LNGQGSYTPIEGLSTGAETITVQADLIRLLMGKFDGNQSAAATACGVSVGRLNNYIRGKRTMDDDAILKCAKCLDLQAEKLIPQHHAETAATPELRSVWKHLTAAAVIVLATGITALPSPAAARLNVDSTMHYAKCFEIGTILVRPFAQTLERAAWNARPAGRLSGPVPTPAPRPTTGAPSTTKRRYMAHGPAGGWLDVT
jgi:hypothetical protein